MLPAVLFGVADLDGILLAVVARLDVLTTESLSVSPIFLRMAVLPMLEVDVDAELDTGLDTGVEVDKDFLPSDCAGAFSAAGVLLLAGTTALDNERRIVSRGLGAVGVEDNFEVVPVNPLVFEVTGATGVFGAGVTAVAVLGRAPTTTTRDVVDCDGEAVRPDIDFLPGVDRVDDDNELDRCPVAPNDARDVVVAAGVGVLLAFGVEASLDAPTVDARVIPRDMPLTGVGIDVDLTGLLLS